MFPIERAPYLALCREDAAQRDRQLRDVFNALRYGVRTGCQYGAKAPACVPLWVKHTQTERGFVLPAAALVGADKLRMGRPLPPSGP